MFQFVYSYDLIINKDCNIHTYIHTCIIYFNKVMIRAAFADVDLTTC